MTTKEKKDPLLVGYMFSYSKEKNPYDFMNNPETGLRPEMVSPPKSFAYTKLDNGIEYATIPPLAIWKDGHWFNDMDDIDYGDTYAAMRPRKDEQYDVWVTSGEGTPGNLEWRMYLLPMEMSRANLLANHMPKHPMMWPKKIKEKRTAAYSKPTTKGSGSSWDDWKGSSSTKKKDDIGLPMGTRIRCIKCGHWFRQDDLPGHVHCCPSVNEFSDWAIKCECCFSMDDTAKVKEGYPREMVAVPVVEPEAQDDTVVVIEGGDQKSYSPIPGDEGEPSGGAGTAAS
jgi:hypothetical protein